MAKWTSTGLDGLDEILCDLRRGDNVVWQVDSISAYREFVMPYVVRAKENGHKVVYMRFAKHKPLLLADANIKVHKLDASTGFESFSTQVHNIISQEGLEAHYVFDCLSDLLSAWATDLMIGNFFVVTCPYLFELDTIAYFALLRNRHSYRTVARIRGTTQLLLDLYDFEGKYYVHPLKVWNRYAPTMFLPHLEKDGKFLPVMRSMDAAQLFSQISERSLDISARTLDHWDRLFMEAESLLTSPSALEEIKQTIVEQLCKIMIGREKRMSELAHSNFSLEDLINIKNRLVGSGYIGGKAAGMLIAQSILLKDESFSAEETLEPHDSFFIGSDVFYTYIVENGWWKLLMEQKTEQGYFEVAPTLKEKMLGGKFPAEIRERFQELIEYFGQSPIIVRSSSLLEDSFGNAFAGKYESIFLVNQGPPEQRYREFENAVRQIYASTMSEDALAYRLQRGLDQMDEQMALLVQRVSGSYHENYFFPDIAGVGVSHNTFVWKPHLDPKAGMVRLVLGLGTRAVDRVEDDYPLTIALDYPLLRPSAGMADVVRFSQHKVDLLDTSENRFTTVDFKDIVNSRLDIRLDLVAIQDMQAQRKMKELGMADQQVWVLTFEKLLKETEFVDTMQKILKTLEAHYHYPVDIEFTANFTDEGGIRINLLQCRPLETKGLKANVPIPENIKQDEVLFESSGYTMGGSINLNIKQLIYVDPKEYIALAVAQKYEIARIVGKLNRQIANRNEMATLLIGPGRWGTTTPSLGVPVKFAEINNISVLAEVAYEGGNLMPDLSFGTHFFQDLVESDIFYAALFPQEEGVILNMDMLSSTPNLLTELVPEAEKFSDVVRVFHFLENRLQIMCDVVQEKVVCFFSPDQNGS